MQATLALLAGTALLTWSCLALWAKFAQLETASPAARPKVKILDRLTDRAALERMIADAPGGDKTVRFDRDKIKAEMKERIFGQDPVIDDVVDQIWGRAAAVDRQQPLGVFLIAGPSGIGKSQFGKALGKALYGNQGAKPFDMSAMNAPENANVLFGSPPGFQGGQGELSTYLLANPRSVVVLEEFEKAHSQVQRRFLNAWQDGFFEDVKTSKKVDTTQTTFVLTTNAREDQIAQLALTLGDNRKELAKRVKEALRNELENSILSRIDHFFAFQPLQKLPFAALVATFIEEFVARYRMSVEKIDYDVLLHYVTNHFNDRADARTVGRQVEEDLRERIMALQAAGTKAVTLSYAPRKKAIVIEGVKA